MIYSIHCFGVLVVSCAVEVGNFLAPQKLISKICVSELFVSHRTYSKAN